jgi:hypothetical protein
MIADKLTYDISKLMRPPAADKRKKRNKNKLKLERTQEKT